MNRWFEEILAETERAKAQKDLLSGTDKTDKSPVSGTTKQTKEVPNDIVSKAAEGPDRTWATSTPDDYAEQERQAIIDMDIQVPRDLELSARERHILRDFQNRFRGTIEWRKP